MEKVTITIDSTNYGIPPMGYCLDRDYKNSTVAIITIMATAGDVAILGDVFIRNWYPKFNLFDNTVSLALSAAGNAWAPNTNTPTTGLSTGTLICIIGGSVLFLIILVAIIVYCCYCRKKKDIATEIAYNYNTIETSGDYTGAATTQN